MPNQDQSISLISVPLVVGTAERDSPSHSHNATMSDGKNPPVRVPQSEEAAEELALEGDEEEPRVTEEQRRNLAEVQARIFDM